PILSPPPHSISPPHSLSFFFTPTAPTAIYTLSLHDALPILEPPEGHTRVVAAEPERVAHRHSDLALLRHVERIVQVALLIRVLEDRKSTRLNSSHVKISYAVFCLKKKKETKPRSSFYIKTRQ